MTVNGERHEALCAEGTISYLLTRKPVKNVNIRIKPDGMVLVSANEEVPIATIEQFIEQKQKYILSTLAKYGEIQDFKQDSPKKYVSGESYTLLGKNLRLKVEESEEETVYTDGVSIFLKVSNRDDFCHKQIMMTKWLKEYRTAVFQKLICEKYLLFQKYGVPYPEIKVRSMVSQWGSCQPQKGIITLNSRLIEAPRKCIEYVILHEFTHFIYPNHSRQFWDFVTMMMPDWKECKIELEKMIQGVNR